MSLYNMMGRDLLAGCFLAILNLSPKSFGRFRDAYIHQNENNKFQIAILSRVGGGNKEYYQSVYNNLKSHPNFNTWDECNYDSTYTEFYFNFPKEYQEAANMFAKHPDNLLYGYRTMIEICLQRKDFDQTTLQNLLDQINQRLSDITKLSHISDDQ